MLGFGPQIKLSQTSLRSQMISLLPGETLRFSAFSLPAAAAPSQLWRQCSGQMCWQDCASHGAISVNPAQRALGQMSWTSLAATATWGHLLHGGTEKTQKGGFSFQLGGDSKACYGIPFLPPLGELFCCRKSLAAPASCHYAAAL